MIENLYKLIDNKINLSKNEKFTAIIGKNPSKTARSPVLWNKAFEKFNLDLKMISLDVKKENLKDLFNLLKNNKEFIGGSITIPYKSDLITLLEGNISEEANKIGSINSLFRKDNKLYGTNTDGEAALKSFENKFGKIKNKKILLLGPGGAGKAVASYFSSCLKNKRDLFIVGRTRKSKNFSKKICRFVKYFFHKCTI